MGVTLYTSPYFTPHNQKPVGDHTNIRIKKSFLTTQVTLRNSILSRDFMNTTTKNTTLFRPDGQYFRPVIGATTAADELRREAEADEAAKHASDAARGNRVKASDGAKTV